MGFGSQGDKRSKSSSNGEKAKKERFNDATFVQYELDKDATAACKKWECDESAAFHAIHTLADKGYSLSVRYDSFSEAYGCFMSQRLASGPNAGFILTGRGSTPFKAVKQCLFKHFQVMGEVWEQFAVNRRADEIDD